MLGVDVVKGIIMTRSLNLIVFWHYMPHLVEVGLRYLVFLVSCIFVVFIMKDQLSLSKGIIIYNTHFIERTWTKLNSVTKRSTTTIVCNEMRSHTKG